MDNKEFGKNLEVRTLRFAIQVIHLSTTLPNTPEARVVRNQFTKAGTSVGANYREVNRSRSKADFIHKIKICETEASETVFWLNVIATQKWVDENKVRSLLKEASELLAIFTSATRNLKINS